MSAARALALLPPILGVLVAGCDEGRVGQCGFGREHMIAEIVAKGFEEIEAVAVGDELVALWSEPAGLFARRLGLDGTPVAPVTRLGPHCPGGLAAIAADPGLRAACLVHPRPGIDEMGAVIVYVLDRALDVVDTMEAGAAGPLSRGVDLVMVDGALHVAWHDGSTGAQRVRWAKLGEAGESQVLSGSGNVAGAPSMMVSAEGLSVAWSERWLEGEELESRVMLWTGHSEPREVLAVHHLAAMPQLLNHRGRRMLAVRDYGGGGARAGLYVTYLDVSGAPVGERIRVARADGVYRPALASCAPGVIAATPRTYGGDYFVGVARLDDELSRPRPEQQFFEDSRAFTRAAAACAGDGALIVIAEHGALERSGTRLRAVPYRCR